MLILLQTGIVHFIAPFMLDPVSLDCPSASAASTSQRALADAIDRIAARLRRGERVDLEHEIGQNPACADGLRLLLPTIEALALVGGATPDASHGAAASDSKRDGSTDELDAATPIEALESKSAARKTLGDFQLLREVGRGGMGIVFEARQVSLARRVAIKVLPAASLLDERQLQRFQNEARAAAQLNHPHIVDVLCVGCDEGVHYFAMRFIEGRTLAEIIAECGTVPDYEICRQGPPWRSVMRRWTLDWLTMERHSTHEARVPGSLQSVAPPPNAKSQIQNPKCADWIAQAAEALEHAHASGIVHRDVKPSNLLIDGDGKLWVTDFGVARFGNDAGLTLTGDLLGTLRYMSPEQALGRLSAVGPPSDVYSLGATFYELLAGRPVFVGDDRGELLRQVAFERPAALRTLDPRLPRDLETIALKALEKSPDDRYASAGEMAADLRRFLRGEPICAKPPTLAERAAKWCFRNGRLVAAAVVLLLMAVAGLLTSTLLVARSRDNALAAQRLAEARDRDNRRMLSVIETGLAMQAYQQGDLARAKRLLDRQGNTSRETSGGEEKNQAGSVGNGLRAVPRAAGDEERNQASGVRRQQGPVGNGLRAVPHAAGDEERNQASGVRHQQGPVGNGLRAVPHAADAALPPFPPHPQAGTRGRGEGASRTREDGLPSPSSQSSDGLGRPSSPDNASEDAYATGAAAPPRTDDFRNFAWHWLRQSIDARYPELKSFGDHPGEVYEVDFSPDGSLLAIACGSGHIILRDAKTGEIRHDISAHESDVNSLDFSPDGALLASVGDDCRVRFWHVATGALAADLGLHDCQVSSVAFSHDGKRLATGDDRGLIIVWDVPNRREEKRLAKHTGRIDSLAFTSDGRLVNISADWYMTAWDVDAARPLWHVAAPHTPFNCLALSPDQKTVATGDRLGIVFLWDLADGRARGRMGLRNFTLQRLAFSPDGRLLASASDEGRAQLWDVGKQNFLGETLPHSNRVWSVAFSPDSATIATGSRDRSVKLWDVEAIVQPRRCFTSREEIGIAFSDDSRTLAVYCDGEAWLWSRGALRPRKLPLPVELNKRVHRDPYHRGGAFVAACVAWFDDELILQDADGALWLADSNGRCRPWIKRQGAQAKRYSLSPDRRWLMLLTTDGTSEIWDTNRAECVGTTPVTRHLPVFSHDSRSFFTCRDARLLRWPLRSPAEDPKRSGGKPALGEPQEVLRLTGDLDPGAISRDGQTLLLGFVQLLDLASLRTTPLVGHHTAINCAALSHDGRTLASGGMDGTVSLWDVSTAQEVCTLERRADGEIGGIAFSPDGRTLAAAGRDRAGGSVTLWELD